MNLFINKNSKSKLVIICVTALAALLLLFSLPIILNSIVYAANNDGHFADFGVGDYEPDPNYATKEYWDTHYGKDRTYLHQSDFSSGKEITSGDYFINEDIEVTGKDDGSNASSAIVINGIVKIYLERKSVGEPGPTIDFTGGASNGTGGSGAGIELVEGNKLYFYGVGVVNAQGGSWKNSGSYPKSGSDGGDCSFPAWPFPIIPFVEGGYGGAGSSGMGGTGAGIGTKGGKGGSGAEQTDAPGAVLSGSQHVSGNDGANGGTGGNSKAAGNLFCYGNVFINAKGGNNLLKDDLSAFKNAGKYGDGDHQTFKGALSNTYGGGGGGGGIGGAGWEGAEVGSGGAGGGGGGAGGSGGAEWTNHREGWYTSGGGGGNGATGVDHNKHGGTADRDHDDDDMDYKAEDGAYCKNVGILNDCNSAGGNGARDNRSDIKHGGKGGNGGLGGLSGQGGIFISPLLSYTPSNFQEKLALGATSNIYKKVTQNETEFKFLDSIVDWCAAYSLKDSNPVEPDWESVHFPSGRVFDSSKNCKYIDTEYIANDRPGTALVRYTGKVLEDEGIVFCGDTFEEAGEFADNFIIVNKGTVDFEYEDGVQVEYNGSAINPLVSLNLNINYEGEDIKSELKPKDIVYEYFEIIDGEEVRLYEAPKNVGDYRIQITVISDDYIGRDSDIRFSITPLKATIEANDVLIGLYDPSPKNFEVTCRGFLNGEEPVEDIDYIVFADEKEISPSTWAIKVILLSDSKAFINYDVTCIDGKLKRRSQIFYCIFEITPGQGTLGYTKTYGQEDPEWSIHVRTTSGMYPEKGKDYWLDSEHSEDVGQYTITVQINHDSEFFEWYDVVIFPVKLTINKADAVINVDSKEKNYGDKDEKLTATCSGLAFGEHFIEGEGPLCDYSLSREQGENAGIYDITANLNPSGPIVKNYKVKAIQGSYEIKKLEAVIKANDVRAGYNMPDKPLSITQVSGFINDEKLVVGDDYYIARERGTAVGEYPIRIKVDKTGSISRNYNITVSPETGTYYIIAKIARAKADDIEATYGDPLKQLTITTELLEEGDTLVEGKDYKISRQEGDACGSYKISLEIIEDGPTAQNYAFYDIKGGTYTINRRNANVFAVDKNVTYGDNPKALEITQGEEFLKDDILTEGKDNDYEVFRTDPENLNVGKYDINIEINKYGPVAKNYNITVHSAKYVIDKAHAILHVEKNYQVYKEHDRDIEYDVLGMQYDDALEFKTDFDITRDPGIIPNEYTYHVTINKTKTTNNYDISYNEATLTIMPFYIDHVHIDDIPSSYYRGEPVCPKLHVSYTFDEDTDNPYTVEFEEGVDYKVSYTDNDKPGTAWANIEGINYCEGFNSKSFQILSFDQAVIIADDKSSTYGDAIVPLTASFRGFAKEDTPKLGVDFALEREKGLDAKTYTISVYVNPESPLWKKYNIGSVNGTYTINKADAIIESNDITKIYKEDDPKLTAKTFGTKYSDQFIAGRDYTISRKAGETAGKYTITNETIDTAVTRNYNIVNKPGIFTIEQFSDFENLYIPQIDPQLYTGDPIYPPVDVYYLIVSEGSWKVIKFIEETDYKLEYKDNVEPGYATITISGIGSCRGSTEIQFIIYKENEGIIFAENKATSYGDDIAPLTATFWGFSEEDTPQLGRDYKLKKDEGLNAGKYDIRVTINPSSPLLDKYDLIGVNGTYIINKALASIHSLDSSKMYKDYDPELEAEVTGTKYGETFIPGKDFIIYREPGEAAGEYLIKNETLNTLVTDNYYITNLYGTFTIEDISIRKVSIVQIEPQEYTGEPICPHVSIYYQTDDTPYNKVIYLTEGTDYYLEYFNNVNPGTAVIAVNGMGSCSGMKTATFDIVEKPVPPIPPVPPAPEPDNPIFIEGAATSDAMTIFTIIAVLALIAGGFLFTYKFRQDIRKK